MYFVHSLGLVAIFRFVMLKYDTEEDNVEFVRQKSFHEEAEHIATHEGDAPGGAVVVASEDVDNEKSMGDEAGEDEPKKMYMQIEAEVVWWSDHHFKKPLAGMRYEELARCVNARDSFVLCI